MDYFVVYKVWFAVIYEVLEIIYGDLRLIIFFYYVDYLG